MTYQSPGSARSSRRSCFSGSTWVGSSGVSTDSSGSTCSSTGASAPKTSGCSDKSDLLSRGALVSECPEHQFTDEEVQPADVGDYRENEHDHDDDERHPFRSGRGDDLL